MTTRIASVIVLFLLADLFTACDRQPSATDGDGEVLLPDPGVVSFSFRNQFSEDIPGTLDMIKDMGLTNIEFSSLFGATAEEMRAMLDERGMICTSYGVGYNALIEDIDQIISDAHTLGAKYVRVASIPHNRSEETFNIEHARKAVEDFNRAGRILKEAGLNFAYHNHGYEFRPFEDGTLFDYIVQNTDPEYVNFEMDLGWVVHPGHDPVELLKKYPDRFYLTHLKDFSEDIEHNYSGSVPHDMNVPFGTGLVDFREFLIAAQNSNIEYHYIEYEDNDVVDVMPGNIEYITNLRN